jgi:hypothetical protein
MRRVITSEVRKLRATPTMWWLLLGAVLLGVGGTAAALAFAQTGNQALDSDATIRGALHSSGSGSGSGSGAMLVIRRDPVALGWQASDACDLDGTR